MWKSPETWKKFDKTKRYKFDRTTYVDSYLDTPNVTLGQVCELAEQKWVDILDGREITLDETADLLAESLGYEIGTIGRVDWFVIPEMWCKEIKEEELLR